MIDGIKIRFRSSELKSHLEQRREYHQNRAKFYKAHADTMGDAAAKDDLQHSMDPGPELKRQAKRHSDQAAFFAVLAEHLIPDETYQLDEGDLARIEIAAKFFG